MTQEEIIEGNKLIAKFMEFKSTNKCVRSESGKYYDYHSNPNFICIKEDEICVESEKGYGLVEQDYLFVEDLKFNSSWDWLMPVVEKIENVLDGDVSVIISDASCSISYSNSYSICAEAYTKIEAIWLACVNFITWYNLQTNK